MKTSLQYNDMKKDYTHLLTNYPDFPAPGVLFRDMSPLLFDVETRDEIMDAFGEFMREKNIDAIAGIDARGFVLGGMLAERYHLPFIMLRKDGKLPDALVSKASYSYEYSSATLTIRKDILSGQRVLVMDDVLATGGTLGAALKLAKENGASEVFGGVLIEISPLKGREKITQYEIFSAIQFS
jgi:adenine phosphoribosyltransferase